MFECAQGCGREWSEARPRLSASPGIETRDCAFKNAMNAVWSRMVVLRKSVVLNREFYFAVKWSWRWSFKLWYLAGYLLPINFTLRRDLLITLCPNHSYALLFAGLGSSIVVNCDLQLRCLVLFCYPLFKIPIHQKNRRVPLYWYNNAMVVVFTF